MTDGLGGLLLAPIAAIWAEALDIEAVGPDDDFLDLGGHSLAAIRVTAQVREIVSQEVPLDLVFRHLVLREYVEALEPFAA